MAGTARCNGELAATSVCARTHPSTCAAKLREAGVEVTTVRYDGAIHDFMLLDPLRDTHAARAATAQAIAALRTAFGTD